MIKERKEPTKTEKKAIHLLESPIVECDFLDSSISSMDKELSWDGYIYSYSGKQFSNKTLDDKIPIQVKGHWDTEHKEISRQSIQYGVDLDVLQNYYNDKGVLYFRILLSDSKKEIFYNILFPSKIKYYLDEAARKKNKKQINITLFKMKQTPAEMLRICRQFTLESSKQGSGRGQIIPKSVCINDINKYKKLQATAIGTHTPYEFMQRLSVGDVCFYANEGESDIWLPVIMQKDAKYYIGQHVKQNISVGGKKYYSQYRIITGTDESISIRVSLNLTINWTKGTFDFKKNSTLDELYNDALFLSDIVNNTEIVIGTLPLKYSNPKLKANLQDDLSFLIDFYNVCNMGNIHISIPLKDFKEPDIRYALRLVDVYRGKFEINRGNIYTYELKIADKIYPFIVYRDEDDKIQFANRVYESRYQGFIEDNGNYYKVPMFCDLKSEIFGHLYKYDFADLLHQVDNADFNTSTLETLNYAVIGLIGAYDIAGEKQLLEVAKHIISKMLAVDDAIIYARINEWQIMKRQDSLTDSELEIIKSKIQDYSEDNQILCGLYALLDDKKLAQEYLNKIPEVDREVFVTFPIYKYVVEES